MQITKIVTDETLRELRSHGTENFPFQYNFEVISEFDEGNVSWHWHKEFEFLKVYKGSIVCLIGNNRIRLTEGMGMFTNTGVIHGIEDEHDGVIQNILFTSDFIAAENSLIYEKYIWSFVEASGSHMVFGSDVEWQRDILKKLDIIFEMSAGYEDECEELKVHIHLCQLWQQLYRHRDCLEAMDKMAMSRLSQSRLRQMMRFIESSYSEKITLGEIADAANISKSEAMRCFRKGINLSPVEYLNRFRLSKARHELETTNESILYIALNTGFESASYFARMFKKAYGISPRSCRKNAEVKQKACAEKSS